MGMNTMLLFINWNPNPELFNLFGISINYYGLRIGIFFALWLFTTSTGIKR